MTIEVTLVADDERAGTTSVSTTIPVDTADPRWPARIVDAVAIQAEAGARRLRDELAAQRAISVDDRATPAFVPLAWVVPAADLGR